MQLHFAIEMDVDVAKMREVVFRGPWKKRANRA